MMSLKDEFTNMAVALTTKFRVPKILNIYFPPRTDKTQSKNSMFIAMALEGWAIGISYVLLPEERMEEYAELKTSDFIGRHPVDFALEFGDKNPVKNMIALAALNAICQYIIKHTGFSMDFATDSLGLLNVSKGDRVGMVGLFPPLVKMIKKADAELVVIEKKEKLIEQFPNLHITLNPTELRQCNKVLCTSTTILNNTLDNILENCASNARVSVIGPTAGYFPDPLFKLGVDVVGGTMIKDGNLFFSLIAEGERWGPATQKFCFQKNSYEGMV